MEDVRKLVPRTPPEGFLTWAADVLSGELDTHGFLYEQEWVEDCGLEVLLDEYARPRKRRMVRVQCSCCGYQDLYHYGRGQRGYGFILPESFTEVEGGTVYEDGDIMLCPQCGCQVQVRRRSALRQKGWFVPAWGRAMSAAVVGEGRLLALTGWVIQRRVLMGGGEHLAAIPAESYVFSATDCAQLMGWQNSYSGTAGFFVTYSSSWRQLNNWTEKWGLEENIYGLTPELVAASCLPHCKLDVYMENRVNADHYPVAWLRLCQAHPNAEALLLHGLPRVLDDLLRQTHREDLWQKNRRGVPELPEVDWSAARPSKMLGMTRDELAMAREMDWDTLFWRLFTRAKAAGETLTRQDLLLAFYLGDDNVGLLPGHGPVAKSIRYLYRQYELLGVEPEDEDPEPYGMPDVQTLVDYWNMAESLGYDLDDAQVRYPADLLAAHDEATVAMEQRAQAGLASLFRVRRRLLARWSFAADGLMIRPASSQKELTDEGNALHHCVGSYGKKHASGETAIFFVRRRNSPRESYYTLELDEKKLEVRQNRGRRNCPRTPEVAAFEALWLQWVRCGAPRDRDGRPVVPERAGSETRTA